MNVRPAAKGEVLKPRQVQDFFFIHEALRFGAGFFMREAENAKAGEARMHPGLPKKEGKLSYLLRLNSFCIYSRPLSPLPSASA